MVRGGRRPPPSALYWRAAASEASYFQALAHSFALFARSELLIALFSIACALFTKKHRGVPLGEGQPHGQILVRTLGVVGTTLALAGGYAKRFFSSF